MIAASTVYSMGGGQSMFAAYSQGYNPTGPSDIEPESQITMKLDTDQDLQTAF